MTEEANKYGGIKSGANAKAPGDQHRKFYYSCGAMDQPTSSTSDPNMEHMAKWYVYNYK
jgi:hypothetical protein